MRALVINIDLKDFAASSIVSIHSSKYEAEPAAQEYAKKFPNSTVAVYQWESGWTSEVSVNVQREFYPPELPPEVASTDTPIDIPKKFDAEGNPL